MKQLDYIQQQLQVVVLRNGINPDGKIEDYKFEFKKMSKSAGLFDLEKLNNISKNYISRLSASDLYDRVSMYLKQYDHDFYEIFVKDKEYSISILNIERC